MVALLLPLFTPLHYLIPDVNSGAGVLDAVVAEEGDEGVAVLVQAEPLLNKIHGLNTNAREKFTFFFGNINSSIGSLNSLEKLLPVFSQKVNKRANVTLSFDVRSSKINWSTQPSTRIAAFFKKGYRVFGC